MVWVHSKFIAPFDQIKLKKKTELYIFWEIFQKHCFLISGFEISWMNKWFKVIVFVILDTNIGKKLITLWKCGGLPKFLFKWKNTHFSIGMDNIVTSVLKDRYKSIYAIIWKQLYNLISKFYTMEHKNRVLKFN